MKDVNFFLPKGPFYLNELLKDLKNKNNKIKIFNIKTLDEAKDTDITFFNSTDYKDFAKNTISRRTPRFHLGLRLSFST